MAVHFPVQVQSFRFRQSLSLWERWHGVSRDGEGKPAAPAAFLHDLSREKGVLKSPQAFQNPKLKIYFPLNMRKAQRRAFPIVR